MDDDAQLLHRFVEARSQPAFAELVQRHLGLVYHAAVRQLGNDRHLADDVAQSVFVLLAERSASLLDHPSLAGWLHTATRFKVARAVRAERRRKIRERTAQSMMELDSESTAAEWERVRPIVDEAVQELNARDREAVLLRYFEDQPVHQIAARLRLTEAAARKTIERAVEKLRLNLARRGVTSSAAAFTTVLGSNGSAAAVPAGLAAAVTASVATSGLPVATVGGLAFMSTKAGVAVTALVMVLVGGVAWRDVQTRRAIEQALAANLVKIASLEERLRRAQLTREQRPSLDASQAVAASTPARSSVAEKGTVGDAFLKAHPEMEAALRAYDRTQLRHTYADLIAQMGLSDAETEQFLNVLASGLGQLVGDHLFRLQGEQQSPEDYTRQLKDVLGDARFRQFQRWRQMEPARSLTAELTASLYSTETTLTPGQIANFKSLVQETLDDQSFGPRYDSVWPWIPPAIWDEVLKRAPTVLSAPQIAALVGLQQQSEFMRAQSAALRAYNRKPR